MGERGPAVVGPGEAEIAVGEVTVKAVVGVVFNTATSPKKNYVLRHSETVGLLPSVALPTL